MFLLRSVITGRPSVDCLSDMVPTLAVFLRCIDLIIFPIVPPFLLNNASATLTP